jgi:hypothetical protein
LAAPRSQINQGGGNPGIEALLAYAQGTFIPNSLRATDLMWPAYFYPTSPTINFLIQSSQQSLFAQFLGQPMGQSLCAYPLGRSATSESRFVAAQNRETLAALAVTANYSQGVILDASANPVPTMYTIEIFSAVAGRIDQFAALAQNVFFPIFGQLVMRGGGQAGRTTTKMKMTTRVTMRARPIGASPGLGATDDAQSKAPSSTSGRGSSFAP